MAIKVAINGYGRIGRNILRALYESNRTNEIQVVAVNDLGDAETNAHLTRHDTAHGRFPFEVGVDGGDLVVKGDRIKVFAERDPAKLPWGAHGVDVVLECTGLFTGKAKACAHLTGGAKKVIISAPGEKDVDATIVYGVNHRTLKATDQVISNASCTTNCLAPLAKVLHEKIGIEHGLMTTIHAYTNDQVLTDVFHKDLRRARSATMSQIPTKTGAAAAVGLVLPELNGRTERHPRHQQGAAGVDRLQPRPALVDLRRHPDPRDGRQLRQGAVLVRQRVGFLEPHAGHHAGADGRTLSGAEVSRAPARGGRGTGVLRRACRWRSRASALLRRVSAAW